MEKEHSSTDVTYKIYSVFVVNKIQAKFKYPFKAMTHLLLYLNFKWEK